jgi:hypothetical protein
MSDNTWEIDGYLLGDPSVDRQSIEQRMLDDPDFALKVAEAAETLEMFAVAAKSIQSLAVAANAATITLPTITHPSVIQSSHSSGASVWKIALAIAAMLVMGAASILFFNGNQRGYDEVANSWLALGQELLPGSSAPIESDVPDGILDFEVEIAASDIDDDDWLIDSAIAFYSDTDSFGKGSRN